jgi:hypothetical protein
MARAGPKKRPKAKRIAPAEQHARFVTAAKEAEADEAPDALDKAFGKLNVTRKPRANRD